MLTATNGGSMLNETTLPERTHFATFGRAWRDIRSMIKASDALCSAIESDVLLPFGYTIDTEEHEGRTRFCARHVEYPPGPWFDFRADAIQSVFVSAMNEADA